MFHRLIVPSVAACLLTISLQLIQPAVLQARSTEPDTMAAAEAQQIVDRLRSELSLDIDIVTVIVPANARLVSVQRRSHRSDRDAFLMSFDARFLAQLDEDELTAIVAHELGHVWIFTHHPYLQTERLANTVAMRVVSRESLERVYTKVWERDGSKGDLAHFLGQ